MRTLLVSALVFFAAAFLLILVMRTPRTDQDCEKIQKKVSHSPTGLLLRRAFPAPVSSPPIRPDTTPHTETIFAESCQACHELDASTPPNVTQLRPATACLACHPATDFAVTHGHTLEPLQDCEMCHSLHGSTVPAKGLLAAPAAVLCNACHDGDH